MSFIVDEESQFIGVVNQMILDDYFDNRGHCSKYIPVLFAGDQREDVPKVLRSSQLYRFPDDRKDMMMRLLRKEKFELVPLGKPPKIVPKVITGKVQGMFLSITAIYHENLL